MAENTKLAGNDEGSPPPNYSGGDVENAGNHPPSYDSLYGKLKDAKQNSSGHVDFTKKCCSLLVGSVGFLILIGILLAVPIAMIVIGALNLKNCPAERYIPIWLIVSGAVYAFMQLTYMGKSAKKKGSNKNDEEDSSKAYSCFNSLLSCFNLAWFIAGNVWVFRIYKPSTDQLLQPNNYCDATAYFFSFWILIVSYICMFLACCCGITFIGCISRAAS